MKYRHYITAILIWAATGLVVSFWYYQSLSEPPYQEVQNRLLWLKVKSENRVQFMERLPGLFHEYPSIGMALYFNDKMTLLGSAYDGERVSKRTYEMLVERYQGKGEISEATRNRLLKFTMPDQSRVILYVHDIFTEGSGPLWLFEYLLARKDGFKWYFILYLFTGVLLFLAYLISYFISTSLSGEAGKGAPGRDRHGRPKRSADFDYGAAPGGEDPWTRINEEFHFSEKAIALLDAIERRFPVKGVAYYSAEDGDWKGVVQKMGGITVRGSMVPVLSRSLIEPACRQSSLVLEAGKSVLIPLMHRGHLVGGIFARFAEPNTCSAADSRELVTMSGDFAQSVFLQRIYDLAVIDTDTEFHTYPYFHFLIQEKLKTSQHFVTIVFELSGINKVTPGTLKSWANLVRGELSAAGFEPELYARLDRGRFALVYNIKPKEGERSVRLNDLEAVPPVLRYCADRKIKRAGELLGGFFLRPVEMDDVHSYFRRLEYLMIHNKMGGDGFRLSGEENLPPQPVYRNAG